MYGKLSDKLHIKPMSTLDYITVENENLNIVFENQKQIIEDASLLLELYDTFCIVGELIYADLLNKHKYIRKEENEKYVPSEQRESLVLVNKLCEELSSAI